MIYRKATINDVKQILLVRHSVNENKLSNPDAITEKDCQQFLTEVARDGFVKLPDISLDLFW